MHGKDPLRDWADIRLFLAILDRGSLVAAAEHLELTQPTVGRRLTAMEERFGTPLFVRAGRRMQLTDAGAAILDSARRMEREMLAIARSLEVQSTALCGEVTISATEGTGTEWLTPVLLDFHRQYPEILLNVQIESRAVDLIRREADIALRLGQPTQPDLIARRLVTVGFGLYASEGYLRRAAPLNSLEDLQAHQHRRTAGPWYRYEFHPVVSVHPDCCLATCLPEQQPYGAALRGAGRIRHRHPVPPLGEHRGQAHARPAGLLTRPRSTCGW